MRLNMFEMGLSVKSSGTMAWHQDIIAASLGHVS